MRIVSLVDNVGGGNGCEPEHGVSLYIELGNGLKVLFDTGQSGLFARNAARLGIDLPEVDLAVISHGHYDHGGGLNEFLRINAKAPIYIRESALGKHYSIRPSEITDIGLKINDLSRLTFTKEIEMVPGGITLFTTPSQQVSPCPPGSPGSPDSPAHSPFLEPAGNLLLLGADHRPDDFGHEQSMIIRDGFSTVLFGGCAHRGIVNILARAQSLTSGAITHVISGFHLNKTTEGLQHETGSYLTALAQALSSYPGIEYYTMHCTGEPAFTRLAVSLAPRLHYLPCGSTLTL